MAEKKDEFQARLAAQKKGVDNVNPKTAQDTMPNMAEGTFIPAAPKEAVQRMTINIPAKMHQELLWHKYQTGKSMTDLIIEAWNQANK